MENTNINTLHNLLNYEISGFLSAELELKNSLKKWVTEASSFQFKTILQKYIEQVSLHITHIEEYVNEQEIEAVGLGNPIMLAYIKETEDRLSYCTNADTRDACLLYCIQQINHHKICLYGTAAAFAGLIGLEKNAAAFHEAEINEKQIDDRLSQLAKYEINTQAKSPVSLPR